MVYRLLPAILVMIIAAAQPAKAQLSPRQIFYDDGSDKKKTPPAKPATVNPPKPKPVKKAPPIPKPVKPGEENEPVKMKGPPETVSQAPYQEVQAVPLALRYSILKILPSDESMEVDAETSFRTGDKIQLLVESNQAGYLYIFSQGTSGTWRPLFPSSEVENGDNRVRPHKPVILPGESDFIKFAGKPGMEKLFILLSRNPAEDIDKLIYQQTSTSRTMMAAAPIKGSAVDKLKVQTRDLVIESVKEKTAASAKPMAGSPGRMSETAVYVATKDVSLTAKVIAEINLKHE